MASWANIRLIFLREVRDQLRDRRTLFTIAVLPMFLYPLLGMSMLQVSQFMRGKPITVRVVGAANLPSEPRLLVDGESPQFAPEFYIPEGPDSVRMIVEQQLPEGWTDENHEQKARDLIAGNHCDAVLYVPADFSQQLILFRQKLAEYRSQESTPERTEPQQFAGPKAIPEPSKEKSVLAAIRVKRILDDWCLAIGRQNLQQNNMPAIVTAPFKVEEIKGPEESRRQAMIWSKILPFVALIWALTGAFYPAIDLCAGEKERGTLETLLSSPALRSEIVWGKLLTVMSFSMSTSLLNLLSLTATGSFIIRHLEPMAGGGGALAMGPPPLAAIGWLSLTLVPISALFSALSLAIASFARSSKEGQYYLMPLLLICLPLMMLPMPSSAELDLGTSLIPITGVMFLLRALIEGQYATAATFAPPVILVTATGCLLSIRWAIDQFNREEVLFRESEQWNLGSWMRHLLRDRDTTPTFGMGVLCAILLLLIRFFASFLLGSKMPTDWHGFAVSTVIFQVALIATPALLMAIMLTRSPRETLLLKLPRLRTLLAAVMLAICLHPAGMLVTEAFVRLYPMNPDMLRELVKLEVVFKSAPHFGYVLAVMALTPAICEELAFRGFVLSGLRHSGRKWTAILVSGLFFGAIHGIMQQSLPACVLGFVLAYLAIHSGSLLPAMLFHLTYNSLSLILKLQAPKLVQTWPTLGLFYRGNGEDYRYEPLFAAACFLIAIGILYWFRSLPYERTAEESLQSSIEEQPQQPAIRAVG